MGAKENAQVFRQGYEAFIAGDMESLARLFNEDAVWHVGGHGTFSGKKHGKTAILS